jgi:hypothetical protein
MTCVFCDDRTSWFLSVSPASVGVMAGKAKQNKRAGHGRTPRGTSEFSSKTTFKPESPWRAVVKQGAHDRFVRRIFGDTATAVSLLRWLFPEELAGYIDWSSVRSTSTAQVTDDLETRYADLTFEFGFTNGSEGMARVLFEHQRRVDPDMALRTTDYNSGMLWEWKNLHPEADHYPLVFNFVLFTGCGGEKWTAPTDLVDLSPLPEQLRPIVAPMVGPGRYTLIDIAHTEPKDILQLPINNRGKVGLVMVRRTTGRTSLHARIQTLMPYLLRMTDEPNAHSALAACTAYIVGVWDTPGEELEEILAPLGPEAKETIVTTAERLFNEGWKQAMAEAEQRLAEAEQHAAEAEQRAAEAEQHAVEAERRSEINGRAKVLLQLLEFKFCPGLPENVVAAVKGTDDPDKLNAWTKRTFAAAGLDEVFE